MATTEHFYHVGASETNTNAVLEAFITNCEIDEPFYVKPSKGEKEIFQLSLFWEKDGGERVLFEP